ncbi:MAG: hypothetical protein ABR925_00775 [Acidimicrobiales bacterium]
MRVMRLLPIIGLILFCAFAANSGAATASPLISSYTCEAGNVPAGTYGSMVISGVCYMPAGTVDVLGNLTIAPGALLDAVTPGDGLAFPTPSTLSLEPAGTALVPATVVVGGNVVVGAGAVLLLGCSPNISCPEAITDDWIGGNLTGLDALAVVVHSTYVGGNFSLVGGGGGPSVVDGANSGACLGTPPFSGIDVPAPAPWADDSNLAGLPVYSDAEDDVIGGNFTESGLASCYLGAFRNEVDGSATISNNTMGDPDAVEVGSNLVTGSLTCLDDDPAVQFGDSSASPTIVGTVASGQCGFNVVQPNPAPEAMEGPGIPEHISVSSWNLGTFSGTFTHTTTIATATLATTESNQTLVGELGTGLFGGGGLVGSASEQRLGTVTGYGSESFVAYDTCSACSLGGQVGSVSIWFYGTTSGARTTKGTFLVTSGGLGDAGLSTLAGWGTFSGVSGPSGTLQLVEHLAIS